MQAKTVSEIDTFSHSYLFQLNIESKMEQQFDFFLRRKTINRQKSCCLKKCLVIFSSCQNKIRRGTRQQHLLDSAKETLLHTVCIKDLDTPLNLVKLAYCGKV